MSDAHTTAAGPVAWVDAALGYIARGERAVLALVTEHRGSTPRDTGSWMLISPDQALATLGGGELERTALEAGRAMLSGEGTWQRSIMRCVLGPDLRQCCGGTVELLLEPLAADAHGWLKTTQRAAEASNSGLVLFDKADPAKAPRVIAGPSTAQENSADLHLQSLADPRSDLALFGAGHVGRALCAMAVQLPLRVSVYDSRSEQCALIIPAANITVVHVPDPADAAGVLATDSAVLIMTHSHALDYALCRAVLCRGPRHGYVGLIGSHSKAQRFRRALKKDGLAPAAIAHLTSPIGRQGPAGKEPGVIALNALVEILAQATARTDMPVSLPEQRASR